jgi:DNA-binding Xre family transcriptional regulator
MNDTSRIVDALKAALKARQMTYGDLALKLKMSEANVKRMFSKQVMTLQRLDEICDALELDFFEIAKLARQRSELLSELSHSQEKDLTKDPRLLGLWYLLANGWTIAQIVQGFELSETEAISLAVKLDRIGVIELGVANSVKLKTTRTVRFLLNGPVRALYGPIVEKSFLTNKFQGPSEIFRFEFRELGQSSISVLSSKLQRLAQEINELADVDEALGIKNRSTVGMMLGLREWGIDDIVSLKRRKPEAGGRT